MPPHRKDEELTDALVNDVVHRQVPLMFTWMEEIKDGFAKCAERLAKIETTMGIALPDIREKVEQHDAALNGRNGTPGLKTDVTTLKDARTRAFWAVGVIAGLVVTIVGYGVNVILQKMFLGR